MKNKMMVSVLEKLMEHLHKLPDSPMDKMMKDAVAKGDGESEVEMEVMPKKAGMEMVKIEAKGPKKMDMMEESDESEMVDSEEEEKEEPKMGSKLLEMLGGSEDDPDLEEYYAKKQKAKDAWKMMKG